MENDIFVLVEHIRGKTSDLTLGMLATANGVAKSTGGRVIALILGKDTAKLGENLAADQVWYFDHPLLADFNSQAYVKTIQQLFTQASPRIVLLGDTTIGSEVAGILSARLGLPLVSACLDLVEDGGDITYTSQICGGKIQVRGDLPSPTCFVAMIPGAHRPEEGLSATVPEIFQHAPPELTELSISIKGYIEPELTDVDISKERILIAVGRGIQNEDNMELAQELADALGGVVCASRPVVDQGWLPTTRLVGKSGMRVRPAVYLALGISGAPEHVEGIGDSDLIIAINTDPLAPIFNIAKYGAEIDLFDLVPALTDQIQQVKSGSVPVR